MTDHVTPQQFEEAGGTEDWKVLGEADVATTRGRA